MILFILVTVWIAAWERSLTSVVDHGTYRLGPKVSQVELQTQIEALGMIDGD